MPEKHTLPGTGLAYPHPALARPVAVAQSGIHARFRDTRPVYVTGKWSAGGQTDGAADAKQVDMPAFDEQWIHDAHANSITRAHTACPCGTRYPGRVAGCTFV